MHMRGRTVCRKRRRRARDTHGREPVTLSVGWGRMG
ncbi:6-O-methylguanine DNA methyltransferase, partial [Streptomyces sp. RP5T]